MTKIALLVFAVGCTHWAPSPVFGQRQEVGRRLVGAPQVEEVIEGGLSGAHGRHFFAAGVEGTKRTHCVQQAEIEYTQDVELIPEVQHRPVDVAGSVMLGLAGVAIVAMASAKYNSDESFYQMDPSFFAAPSTPVGAYAVGGGMIAGGAGWLIYSLTQLPKGGRPAVEHQRRDWTETSYVEATGCGLVPADH
jgi:hypothetical protein